MLNSPSLLVLPQQMIGPFRRHITTFIFGGVNRKIVTFSETPVRWRTPLRYAETFQNKREVGNIAILQYAICNMHGGDISSLAASSRQGVYSHTKKDSNSGTGSNNQNGNLRWILPLGVGPTPPPLMAQISRHFFTPLFFFCN